MKKYPCCPRNLSNIVLTLGIATPGNRFFFWKLLGTWSIRTDAHEGYPCMKQHTWEDVCVIWGVFLQEEKIKNTIPLLIVNRSNWILNLGWILVFLLCSQPSNQYLVHVMNAFQSVNPSSSPEFLQPQICAILFCSELVLYLLLEIIWVNILCYFDCWCILWLWHSFPQAQQGFTREPTAWQILQDSVLCIRYGSAPIAGKLVTYFKPLGRFINQRDYSSVHIYLRKVLLCVLLNTILLYSLGLSLCWTSGYPG